MLSTVTGVSGLLCSPLLLLVTGVSADEVQDVVALGELSKGGVFAVQERAFPGR